MRVLIKLPSRSRPDALKRTMLAYEKMWSGNNQTAFLVSADSDDPTMEGFQNPTKLPCLVAYGTSTSKIHAINRDVDRMEWDILIVGSDDMIPLTPKFDDIIRREFERLFDSTDGALWCPDGYNYRICCQPVIGRKYYDRFGYIYHPDYKSLYCDDEFTIVGKKLGLLKQTNDVKFDHIHYRNRKRQRDELDKKNESFMRQDYELMRDRIRSHFK